MKFRAREAKVTLFVVFLALLGIYLSVARLGSVLQIFKTDFFKSCKECAENIPVVATIDPRIKQFGLRIDKLGILAPIVQDVNGKDREEYNSALRDGVAHYDISSLPDEGGNIFIFGHSSSDVVPGENGRIFAKLNELDKGDKITVYFQEKDYKYIVSEDKIVEPTDTSVLDETEEETLTLMTCWPLGTKDKRLIIRAIR
jgi:LPXTG-site transpeptidase (sortase) family protein